MTIVKNYSVTWFRDPDALFGNYGVQGSSETASIEIKVTMLCSPQEASAFVAFMKRQMGAQESVCEPEPQARATELPAAERRLPGLRKALPRGKP